MSFKKKPHKTVGLELEFCLISLGERLDGVDSETAAQKLRGRAGTTVTVKVHRVSVSPFH